MTYAEGVIEKRRAVIRAIAKLPEPFTFDDAFRAANEGYSDFRRLVSYSSVAEIVWELLREGDLVRVSRTDGRKVPLLHRWAES